MATRTRWLRGISAIVFVAVFATTSCAPPAPSCRPTTRRRCPKVAPPTTVPPRPQAEKTRVFSGLGAWADVYDWSTTYAASPRFTPASIDRLADSGVQVLYLQSGKAEQPVDIVDRDLFKQIVDRAHARGLRVVSWYLPKHIDLLTDGWRLVAPLTLGVDGIAMDIESTAQTDLALRNKNLKLMALFIRAIFPNVAMAAIVLPPVVTDVLNLNYWPDFPWSFLRPLFDAWMPMGYWTNRAPESGFRDGERYTSENIDRIRAHLGDPAAPVHPVGGIADKVTPEELAGFVASAQSRGAIGGSLYDDTTGPDLYAQLQTLRR